MQRNLSNPTTSGARFYASVIKSAMEKVDNVRRHKKLEDVAVNLKPPIRKRERKKAEPKFPKFSALASAFRQPEGTDQQPQLYETHIIVGLALFPIGVLVACLQIATPMYRDENYCDLDIMPMITASLSIFDFSPNLSEIRGADILKNFGWIAALLQVLVLPYIFPTPFGLILERFQASDKFQKMVACLCVCVCVCVHTCISSV